MFDSVLPPDAPDHLRWKYARILPGATLEGWSAGRMVGVLTHWRGIPDVPAPAATRACRSAMTQGRLRCDCCAGKPPRWVGYLPIYAKPNGARQVVAVSADAAKQYLSVHPIGVTPVTIRRTTGARDPLIITLVSGIVPAFVTKAPANHDIRPWLLHLWGDELLADAVNGAIVALELEAQGSTLHIRHSQTHVQGNGVLPH